VKAYNKDYPHSALGYMPLINMRSGSMLLPHNRVSDGVQDSQIMIPSFFDRFYIMPPLTNGVHYSDPDPERFQVQP